MSAKTTLSGIITDIFPAEIKGSFEKRVVWVKETDAEQYPEHYSIEFQQGKVILLDKSKVGDHVNISVNVRGKKWTKDGRESIFNSLVGWKIEKVGERSAGQPSTAQEPKSTPAIDEPIDDLPF